jgi:hypothetical protein
MTYSGLNSGSFSESFSNKLTRKTGFFVKDLEQTATLSI